MNDVPALTLALFAGFLLGILFFGGLWWTVQRGVTSERPEVWFLVSLVLRVTMILAGFYVVAHGHWSRLVACLVGFLIARILVVKRLAQMPMDDNLPSEQEANDAP